MKTIAIIGGGPAGIMAAIKAASKPNSQVILIEKNNSLGKKLLLTGGGRCNITNLCDIDIFLDNIKTNPNFMYSSYYTFPPESLIDFFEEKGIRFVVENGRVYPSSHKSEDILAALEAKLSDLNVKILLSAEVEKISADKIITIRNHKKIKADSIVIATGGLSYPSTGCSGDGFKFAKAMGHRVTPLYPSLTSIQLQENVESLAGISLKNIGLTAKSAEGKTLYKKNGELLFTHKGISGPVAICASRHLIGEQKAKVFIDMSTYIDEEILFDVFSSNQNKAVINALESLLPKKLLQFVFSQIGLEPDKKVNIFTKEERNILIGAIKELELSVSKLGGFNEAIVTSGGVNVSEINPSTMESKLIEGVFFAGEVIDVDGYTGGFNLQIAFSTGVLAGLSV